MHGPPNVKDKNSLLLWCYSPSCALDPPPRDDLISQISISPTMLSLPRP